jgi:hypothetical protein
MAKAKVKKDVGPIARKRESLRERFARERGELQKQQSLRDAKAVRRAVIHLDEGEADSGLVENIISADEDFRIPGKLIVPFGDGCEIGGRYERGIFKRGSK